jgi:hypothetical protein
MSWNGYCGVCGPQLFREHANQLHAHDGPAFEQWRRAMAASVGAVLVDYLDFDT